MRKPKEGDTVRAILQFLALHHIPAWRVNTGATKIGGRFLRFGAVGMADIVGVIPSTGQFLAIEVKSRTGKPTLAQLDFLGTINESQGIGFVARSVADVLEVLGPLAARQPASGQSPASASVRVRDTLVSNSPRRPT